jgi:hypothetical protein
MTQICDDIVLNPKFNTQLFNVGLQILFSNLTINSKTEDYFGSNAGRSKGPIFPKAPKPAVKPSHLLFDG